MNSLERAKNILLIPQSEWAAIEPDPAPIPHIYLTYIMPLAAIAPIARFVGEVLIGYGGFHVPVVTGIIAALVQYVLALGLIYVLALTIVWLAPTFEARRDLFNAFKLAAYSWTPVWLAGIFGLLPALLRLQVLGLYGILLLYLGVPILMRGSADKAAPFTAAIVIAAVILATVADALVGLVVGGPGFAA